MTLKLKHLASHVEKDVELNVGLHLGSLWGPLVEDSFLLTLTEMCKECKIGHAIEIATIGLCCCG